MACYTGSATITAVDGQELRWTKGLTDEQIVDAMNIVITVKPEDPNFSECDLEVEISERECVGKLAGKTRSDVSLQNLARAKLISAPTMDALEELFPDENGKGGCVGKQVSIFQKETQKKLDDGTVKTYVNTYLSSFASMSRSAISERLARLRGKRPSAVVAPEKNPFD